MVNGTVPASPNFIAIFYESNTEGTNFWICLYVLCLWTSPVRLAGLEREREREREREDIEN